MTDRLGPAAWRARAGAGLELGRREYSEETAHTIDIEIQRLLTEQQERAREVLGSHREALEAVAGALIEQETLSGSTVAGIIESAGSPLASGTPGWSEMDVRPLVLSSDRRMVRS